MLALSLAEVLILYAIPVGVLVAVWLVASLVVYVIAAGPFGSPLRADIRRKHEAKARLRSGRGQRLSYPYVAFLLLGDNCIQATVLYRLSRFCVQHRLGPLGELVHSLSKFLTNLDVSPYAEIGPGVYFYHGLGTVIGKGTRIGRNALICQNVTTGGGPGIGDDVSFWAGAKIIGRVRIGHRAEVGANAVVISDVPADTVAIGVPATRFIPKGEGDPAAMRSAGYSLGAEPYSAE